MLKQQGILKYLSKLPFLGEVRSNFRAQNIENGRKIHQQNIDRFEKANATKLEAILEISKKRWLDAGYNAEEMLKLEEAWSISAIKDKENYRADKKLAKQLRKEVQTSFLSRKK
tara:strand:- start:307 stop:648 length:342 start_codon:yes stop_codon:yes gene_type:complete